MPPPAPEPPLLVSESGPQCSRLPGDQRRDGLDPRWATAEVREGAERDRLTRMLHGPSPQCEADREEVLKRNAGCIAERLLEVDPLAFAGHGGRELAPAKLEVGH